MSRKEDLAYIAGLFDGEGNIDISRYTQRTGYVSYVLHVSIANTYRDALDFCKRTLGYGTITKKVGGVKRTIYYNWEAETKQAGRCLRILFPYMIIKSRQAELAIKFQSKMRHREFYGGTPPPWLIREREEIKIEIMRLNHDHEHDVISSAIKENILVTEPKLVRKVTTLEEFK